MAETKCKYYKQKKQVSYDGGVTWQDVIPYEYQKGELYEYESADCGALVVYRWVNMDSSVDYYCEGTTKYYKQKKQVSYDGGQTWQDVSPAEYQRGGVAETQSTDCGYVPPVTQYRWIKSDDTICVETPTPSPYQNQYFTVSAIGNVTFGFNTKLNQTYQYTLDGGSTWTTGNSATSVSLSSGQKIMIKGNLIPQTQVLSGNLGIGSLNINYVYPSIGGYDLEGNVMSLLFGDDFSGKTDLTGKDYAFYYLVGYTTNVLLKNVNNLILPATTLSEGCYERMFEDCASITTAPVLPATILSKACYERMFGGCTNLNYIKCLATDISATTCTASWVHKVAASGTFVKAATMNDWSTGESGIPEGWTVIET